MLTETLLQIERRKKYSIRQRKWQIWISWFFTFMRGFYTAGKMLTGTRQRELGWSLLEFGCIMGEQLVAVAAYLYKHRTKPPTGHGAPLWWAGGIDVVVLWHCRLLENVTWRSPGALSYLWEVVVFFLLFLFQHCALSAAAHIDLRGCSASCRRDDRQGPAWRWQGQGDTHLPWKLHFAWDYFQQDVAPTSHLCHHGAETSESFMRK